MHIDKLRQMAEEGKRTETIRLLEQKVSERKEDGEALLLLGELIYAEGRMPEALNKFNAVLRLEPNNQKARNYVTMINNILGYYCKDMFNP